MTGLGSLEGGRPCHAARLDRHPRGPRSQSEGHRRPDSAQPAGCRYRPVRLGQVVAGVRHPLRRRAAALRRIAFRLRPPVPGTGREAGRRSDRRSFARHLHRAAHHRVESAVDGGDRHRDLRLSPPAVRQYRGAALSVVRARDHVAIGGAHRRDGHGRARGRAGQRPRAHRARPQGRVQEGAGRHPGTRTDARPDRRGGARRRGGDPPGSAAQPLDRSRGGPARRAPRRRAAPHRVHRVRTDPCRRRRHHQHAGRRRQAVLAPDGLRRLRNQRPRDDAARLLLQLAARCVSRLPRARRRGGLRSRPDRARRNGHAVRGRHRGLGGRRPPAREAGAVAVVALLRHRARRAVRQAAVAPPRPVALRPERRRDASPRARVRPGDGVPDPVGSIRSARTSRASFPTCGAATTREPGRSRRRWRATGPCSHARRAAAGGCGPRVARYG